MMRAVVIGSSGQLGSDLMRAWPVGETTGLTHAEIDVTNREQVFDVLARTAPDVVVNTAAFHNVDVCESEPERAFQVNAAGAMNVADACHELGAALMFISTDYVFAGDRGRPYVESDPTTPISVYGTSKAAGEQLVRSRLAKHYVVRTSGLYGVAGASGKGGNFVMRMLELGRDGKDLRVVDDQVLSPTFTQDLAEQLLRLASTEQYGTYHITNAGQCSWYALTKEIFRLTDTEAPLSPTTTAEFGAKAPRPAYSVLANEASQAAGLPAMRPWSEALRDFLEQKRELVTSKKEESRA
jgi:dTDP-4-dehydrorhamnose reductase